MVMLWLVCRAPRHEHISYYGTLKLSTSWWGPLPGQTCPQLCSHPAFSAFLRGEGGVCHPLPTVVQRHLRNPRFGYTQGPSVGLQARQPGVRLLHPDQLNQRVFVF